MKHKKKLFIRPPKSVYLIDSLKQTHGKRSRYFYKDLDNKLNIL